MLEINTYSPVPLALLDGADGHNMGGGLFIVERRDDRPRAPQRVVVTEGDREALLAFEDFATAVGPVLEELTATYIGDDLWLLEQLDHSTGDWQSAVVTRGDLEAMRAVGQ